MTKTQLTIEILKLIVSLITPLLVLVIGLMITRKIEKNKLNVLKEKEWQVKWAEMFLKHATEFNDNISQVVCALFRLQTEKEPIVVDEIMKTISASNFRLSEIDWNIRNYAQFSTLHEKEVIENQQQLMSSIRTQFLNEREV